VTNPATGINIYQYFVPLSLPTGDYLVVWDGEDIAMSPVQASETITILAGVSSQTSGPCENWTPIWCCDLLDMSAVTGTALQAATEVLFALSGFQFNSCPIELWPCRQSCYGGDWPFSGWGEWGSTYPQPAMVNGSWMNLTCGQCLDPCSCTVLSQISLPGPIIEIIEVRVDDVVLVPNVDYRLDNGHFLTRLGGLSWPTCNDLSQTAGEGTWSVTISYGKEVPILGQYAVGELACEFAKACVGDDTCQLPKPVQQLSRQGVSMTFLDPNELFADGRVGLYFSDLFIGTFNPGKRRGRSRVYDIDKMEPRRLGS
jgi:hypothetical protein